jgi:YegS/Rv2252/BmrU family lipid kinase
MGYACRPLRTAFVTRALFLVNANSRNGAESVEAAVAVLRAAGVELVTPDPSEQDLSDLILAHREDCSFVVAGGGDGTMNAAARGLMETGLPLGLLPLGTGNDLARTLGLPLDLAAAARVIVDGALRDIDVGEVNGRLFFNVASIGLSAELADRLDPSIKRRWGRFGYVIAAIKALWRARPFTVSIFDGARRVRARTYQVAVGNGRYYGGGNAVHHAAEIDDGVMHLYSLEVKSVAKLVLLAPFFRAGTHGQFEEVRAVESDHFEVATRRPRPINADGEIVGHTPARFHLHRNAVKVFAPRGSL